MKIKGIDTIETITPDAAKTLIAEEYSFVGRYVVPETGLLKQKALTAVEAKTIHDAGLSILCIYETSAERAKKGASAGKADGESAKKRAQELGIPKGTVIYFAVDYNAPKSDYDAIKAYFKAAKDAAAPYLTGVYGSQNVCSALAFEGLAGYYQCYAWSNGVSSIADVFQSEWQQGETALSMQKKLGFAVDIDLAYNLGTMWRKTKPQSPVEWMEQLGFTHDPAHSDVTWEEFCKVQQFFHGDDKRLSGLLED